MERHADMQDVARSHANGYQGKTVVSSSELLNSCAQNVEKLDFAIMVK